MTDKLKYLVSTKKIGLSSSKFKVTLVDPDYTPKSVNTEDVTWEAANELIHSPPIILNINQQKG